MLHLSAHIPFKMVEPTINLTKMLKINLVMFRCECVFGH